MRAVLGIDAAWTETQPSGVALVAETNDGWHLVAVESSYQRFHALASGAVQELRPSGSLPSASTLLETSQVLCGRPVALVAIDMPLSLQPITCRRESDNAVSRAYGGRKCSTHTPSSLRPGRMSDALRGGFHLEGYPLQTSSIQSPGLIEVYPHPALLELALAPERVPYKSAKVRKYWPALTPPERKARLIVEWTNIIGHLDAQIAGVATAFGDLDPSVSGIELKTVEDAIDAVVCAWVAICALDGRATAFGDDVSAIWVPHPTKLPT
ncbi:MAG: DUF429 domain-containing protein [Fimbriimonadaceae bacterium]|nr:DUF429 domain-containing protein [Fimbriimonadaceae bacterium]